MPSNTVKFTPEKPAKDKKSHGLGITIFSAVILVIIVVTFIGAPVVSKVSEQPGYTFGSYDGIPVEFVQGNAFAKNVEQLNRAYEQYTQGGDNVDFIRQLVWRQAFERTALEIGLRHEAELAGIVVTDSQIDKQLINLPEYQANGQFSEELYRNTAAADRFRYRQEAKNELLVQQYALDHTRGALVSQATLDFVASMAYPQKKFTFVTFTDADYPAAQVADYAAKNKGLFRTIDLSKITITTSEADATKVQAEAVKGEKAFADLAKTYSKDSQAEAGGALGVRHYYELKSDVPKAEDLDKIFALQKGAISAVVKGEKTWTIYKVNAPSVDADLTSADTLAVVRAYIAKNERGLVEDNLEAQAQAFAAAVGSDFAGAAKKIGKTPAESGFVAVNFGNHDLFPSFSSEKDPAFRSLATNEDFFKKAFRLGVGQVSAPILASPAVLVVKVEEVKAAPGASDTPVSPAEVAQVASSDRGDALQKSILSGTKFKDQFQTEFARAFKSNP